MYILSLDELRFKNAQRNVLWDPEGKIGGLFRATEFAGEAGEVCNVLKKLEREKMGLRGSRDTTQHLGRELADVIICADLVGLHYNLNLSNYVREVFNSKSEEQNFPVFL